MGFGIGISRDRYPDGYTVRPQPANNPDPREWQIIRHEQIGKILIVAIRYPNCTNYEGLKFLVYKDTDIHRLRQQLLIDPHFSDNPKYCSPLARFQPDAFGWNCAILFAREYNDLQDKNPNWADKLSFQS
jgi:nitroreductase